jgi:hypothetical protein
MSSLPVDRRIAFLIRISPSLRNALKQWAADEQRSVNSQIAYILREALIRSNRPLEDSEPPEAEQPPAG